MYTVGLFRSYLFERNVSRPLLDATIIDDLWQRRNRLQRHSFSVYNILFRSFRECLCAQTKCTAAFTFQHLYIFMRLFYLKRCALCSFSIHSWFFHGHTSENNETMNCFVLFVKWLFFFFGMCLLSLRSI